MSPFEQQVYEALEAIAEAAGEYEAPCGSTVRALAPRVAAAIETIAIKYAAEVENEHGRGMVPDGDHYVETLSAARSTALAALRGGA